MLIPWHSEKIKMRFTTDQESYSREKIAVPKDRQASKAS